ncbi:MAG: hypothetical protein PUI49_08440 [Prevotellaceae bacterium]|nr:hypothetical protein [Prevotellaceae bacterium]MDY5208790.1 hypothetical protein [Prevotella sp.]
MATYDEQIITILAKAGERGMSVKKVSMQLYNINCTLFSTPDFNDIHKYVQQFLFRNSRLSQSLFCNEARGIYKLNPNSARAQQLALIFAEDSDNEDDDEEQSRNTSPDLSLSLFDEWF